MEREEYFIDLERDIEEIEKMMMMVKGGIRRSEVEEKVIERGIEMEGIEKEIEIEKKMKRKWRMGREDEKKMKKIEWKKKKIED